MRYRETLQIRGQYRFFRTIAIMSFLVLILNTVQFFIIKPEVTSNHPIVKFWERIPDFPMTFELIFIPLFLFSVYMAYKTRKELSQRKNKVLNYE
jgi:hypothetical protein